MIELIFYFGTEIVMLRINRTSVTFANSEYGAVEAPIDNIKLNHEGVVKEFPDLKDKDDWKGEAIKRFKEKIKSFESEEAIADYLIDDLVKFGYVPKFMMKQGFRRIKLG